MYKKRKYIFFFISLVFVPFFSYAATPKAQENSFLNKIKDIYAPLYEGTVSDFLTITDIGFQTNAVFNISLNLLSQFYVTSTFGAFSDTATAFASVEKSYIPLFAHTFDLYKNIGNGTLGTIGMPLSATKSLAASFSHLSLPHISLPKVSVSDASVASVGEVWYVIIDKLSDPLVPLFEQPTVASYVQSNNTPNTGNDNNVNITVDTSGSITSSSSPNIQVVSSRPSVYGGNVAPVVLSSQTNATTITPSLFYSTLNNLREELLAVNTATYKALVGARSTQADSLARSVGSSITNITNNIDVKNISNSTISGGSATGLSNITTASSTLGTAAADSLVVTGNITANAFYGDGSHLTGISGGGGGASFSTTTTRGVLSATSSLSYDSSTGTFGVTSGYSIPLTASSSSWNTFFNTPSTQITAGTGLSWSGNTLSNSGVTSIGGLTGAISTSTLGISSFSTTTTRGIFSATSPLSYDSSSGTFGVASGYSIPLSASTTAWQNFLTTPSSAITAGTGLSWSGNMLTNNGVTSIGGLTGTVATSSLGITSSQWGTNGSSVYYSGGNVGVGTSDPQAKLDVRDAIFVRNTDGAAGSNDGVEIATDASAPRVSLIQGNRYVGLFNADAPGNTYLKNVAGGDLIFTGGSGGNVELARLTNAGNLGIGTTSPDSLLTVAGNINITGALKANYNAGTSGQILQTTGSGVQWVSTSTLGIVSFSTTTSRGVFSATSPLSYDSTNGIFSVASGYSIPLTASSSNWNTFFNTPSTQISAGTGLSWSGNTLSNSGVTSIGGLTGAISTSTLGITSATTSIVGTANQISTSVSGNTVTLSIPSSPHVAGTLFIGGGQSLQWGDNSTSGTITGFLSNASDGVFRFGDSTGGGSPRIILGSASNTFVSLKRDGAGLDVRLGDDTGYASTTAANFNGVGSTASFFRYASTTALTVSAVNGLTVGSLTGPLQAVGGVVSSTSTLSIAYGGTGLSSSPAYGQLLLGNSSGGYTLTATSSLGLSPLWTSSGSSVYFNGNVGVGSTTPWGQLSASSTSAYPTLAVEQKGSGAAATFLGGNIGIGTTSPGSLLSVAGDLNITGALKANFSAGTSGYVLVSNGSGSAPSWTATSSLGFSSGSGSGTVNSGTLGQIAFYGASGTAVSGTSTLFLSNGSVGLGTSTPIQKFTFVGSNANNKDQITFDTASSANGDGVYSVFGPYASALGGDRTAQINITNNITGTYAKFRAGIISPASGAVLEAGAAASGAAYAPSSGYLTTIGAYDIVLGPNATDALHLKVGGNVGIGDTSPGAKLSVVSGNPATPYAGIKLLSGGSTSYTSYAIGRTAVEGYWFSAANANDYVTGTAAGDSGLITTGGKLFFSNNGVGGASAMVLSGSKLGIGTTTPGSLLSVGNTNGINFGTATSTFSTTGGINLVAGCFAINGSCIGGSGGASSQWTTSGNNIYYTTGNVGIGTTTPTALLQVTGTTSNQLTLGYDTSNYSTYTVDSGGGTTIATTGTSPNYSINMGSGGNFSVNGALYYSSTNRSLSLNNTSSASQFEVAVPIAATNAVPTMTSYTAPSGIASSTAEYNASSWPTWQAFDGSITTKWFMQGTSGFLSYQFAASKAITSYKMYGAIDPTWAPKNWTFEGYNGTSWVVLDTRSNVTSWSGWNQYTFTNTTLYSAYRINVTANNGGAYLGLEELQMFEANSYTPGFDVTTGGLVGVGTSSPGAKLAISNYGGGNQSLFVVASSSGALATSTNFIINNFGKVGIGTSSPAAQLTTTGTVQFANFGAGTLSTDANGNLTVSSDERLKDIQGDFTDSLSEILAINPILYKWKADTGLDTGTVYAGFSAQNVKENIPEAVGVDKNGFLTLSDRPIIAALVNAVKEIASVTDDFKKKLVEWFGSATNGIHDLFVGTSHQETLCVGSASTGETCVTKTELDNLLRNAGQTVTTYKQQSSTENSSPADESTSTVSSTNATSTIEETSTSTPTIVPISDTTATSSDTTVADIAVTSSDASTTFSDASTTSAQ